MSTSDDLVNDITKIIQTEGGLVNNPADPGGRTFEGISEKANPDLWKNGPPTPAQVRQRYMERFVVGPGYDKVNDAKLQYQLIDFGVNSGPAVATKRLQEVLGLPGDGVLGPATLAAVNAADARTTNNKLAVKRIEMIGRLVQQHPAQLTFLGGWLDRATSFIY